MRARRFVTISPHLPRDFVPDSMFVLDRRHVWFTVFWEGGGRERLYRTSDGGTSWHWNPVPSHVSAAGSADALWFTDSAHGWLTDIQPTGENARLYFTPDGGRRWHVVADSDRHSATRTLPTIGTVQYQPDGTTAWDAAPPYWVSTDLYVTRNGGDTWQPALTARHHIFAAPGVFGSAVVEPVTWCAHGTGRARLLVSHDDGAHWAHEPAIVLGTVPRLGYSGAECLPAATAVADPNDAWTAALVTRKRLVVTRTCDDGRHWQFASPPRRSARGVDISATDCLHGLLDTRDTGGVEHLYVTNDGGASWRSINERATR